MDDRTAGESPHELLLALAGRVDDDLLAWCRELVAVGEDARASELVTATLIADRTPLPAPLRAALVRAARTDLDAEAALAPAADEHGTPHLFSTELPGAQDLAAAVGALSTRQIAGCRSWATLRTTPAGTAPGPLPHAVVLVEVAAGDTRPVNIMAYQLAIACARTGVPAAVEVVVAGAERPAYHQAALQQAIPVHGAAEPVVEPPAAEVAAPVVEDPAPELLSPGSLQPLLSVPPEPAAAVPAVPPVPRPFPRRAARPVDDEAGAAFRAASAQPGSASAQPASAQPAWPVPFAPEPVAAEQAAPEPFAPEPDSIVPGPAGSALFASAPPAGGPSEHRSADEGLFDAGPAPATDPAPATGPADGVPADGVPADGDPSGEEPADDRPTDPGPGDAPTPGPARRPRPVTALRGLAPATPRPNPARSSGGAPMPRPQPVPSPGRRGNLSPVGEPAAVRALPAPADTPAFASIGDPLDGPIEDHPIRLGERDEPMIDENDPLGLGPMPVPASKKTGPAEPPVSDSWLADWVTGDWAMSPSALDGPIGEVDPFANTGPFATTDPAASGDRVASGDRAVESRPSPRPGPEPEPGTTRAGHRRADARRPFPGPDRPTDTAGPGSGEREPDGVRPVERAPVGSGPEGPGPDGPGPDGPGPDGREPDEREPDERMDDPPAVGEAWDDPIAPKHRPVPYRAAVEHPDSALEQTGFVLRPESVARLSDTDRELLARLQAELGETPRPRVTRRAGIAGSNGSADHGGPSAPPDMAG